MMHYLPLLHLGAAEVRALPASRSPNPRGRNLFIQQEAAPTTKSYPVSDVNCFEAEKPSPSEARTLGLRDAQRCLPSSSSLWRDAQPQFLRLENGDDLIHFVCLS